MRLRLYLMLLAALAAAPILSAAPLRVVAANSIAGDWVRQVGGNAVELTVLAGPGADVHTYEPTPRDVRAIARADIVFSFGLGLETWLDGLLDSSGSEARRIVLADGLPLLPAGADSTGWPAAAAARGEAPACCQAALEADDGGGNAPVAQGEADRAGSPREAGMHEEEDPGENPQTLALQMDALPDTGHAGCAHGPDHPHHPAGGMDPHMWLSVPNAMTMVVTINEVLAEEDAQHAQAYDRRAAAYLAELQELDAAIREQVSRLMLGQRKLIPHHDNMRYFAKEYGFTVPASILGSVTTAVGEPSARQFRRLIELIREERIPAVFAENMLDPRLPRQVAREAGLPEPAVLYTGALSPEGGPAPDYLSMMRGNAGAIVHSLGQ